MVSALAADITGAGSTFVFPILAKWAADYNAKTCNRVNYQSIGSGGGLQQIRAGTVEFGEGLIAPEEALHRLNDLDLNALAHQRL